MATTTTTTAGQTSFTNTPQAVDDFYVISEDDTSLIKTYEVGTENEYSVYLLDVMSNDLGGKAKTLYSVDDTEAWDALKTSDVLKDFEATQYGGQIRIRDGKVEYKSGISVQNLAEGEKYVDVFHYTIRLGNGTLSEATVTITIVGANDAPTDIDLSNHSVLENEAGAVIGILTTTDVDSNDTHTYTVSDERFEVVNGELKLKAGQSLNFENEQAVTMTIITTDNHNASFSKNFTLNVTDVNEAPSAGSDIEATIAENVAAGAVLASVLASEPDVGGGNDDLNNFENLTYEITAGNDNGLFEVDASGNVKLADGKQLDFETANQHVLTVKVTDGGGLNDSAQVTIKVTDVNEAPSAGSDIEATIAENVAAGAVLASVLASDPDVGGGNDDLNNFENLTYEITGGNDSGLFEVDASGNVKLADGKQLDFETANQHVLTVKVTDGGGLNDSAQVTIKVTDVNEAPVITFPNSGNDVALNIAENTATNIVIANVDAFDIDGNTLIYSLTGTDATLFDINTSTGEVSFKNSPNFEAPADADLNNIYNFSVIASDGSLSDSQNFAITVTDVFEGVITYDPYTGIDPLNDQDFDNLAQLSASTGTINPETLFGTSGADSINGQNGNDLIYGAAGNDVLNGNNDNDIIYGGSGNDTIDGGGGTDLIWGGSGNDSITGQTDSDAIFGGSGNDTINGGGGTASDVIIGGYGADSLTGGNGNDTFVFTNILDRGDTITDFQGAGIAGGDIIDFSSIDANPTISNDQAFQFWGNTATAYGLWYATSGANSTVYIDTDGNVATAELSITLTGVTSLIASDFVL